MKKLIAGVCEGIGERSRGSHVLLIQDTSEINYQAHAKRVGGLGVVGNNTDVGLFVHPVLVVNAQDGACLGLAHLHHWQRPQGRKKVNSRSPIEDKESHRWIDAIDQARVRLEPAALMTVVADRECDIYEMWARLPDARTQLLVRAQHDRELQTSDSGTLFDWLGQLPPQGCYQLKLQATKDRGTRTARMHVRFGWTRIMRPTTCTDKNAPESVLLWAIEVIEDPSSVPTSGKKGESAVHWRLLTTHPLHSLEDALQCVDWYCQRWHIEQTFRTLKSQGLDIESSLVEEGARLEKLAVLALSAAVHTMQLTLAREGQNQRPATDCFNENDHVLLQKVGTSLEGKTAKQKNAHPVHSLAWAAWIVARLGGWKGYASERKPGPITMLHGLQALADIRRGWELAQDRG